MHMPLPDRRQFCCLHVIVNRLFVVRYLLYMFRFVVANLHLVTFFFQLFMAAIWYEFLFVALSFLSLLPSAHKYVHACVTLFTSLAPTAITVAVTAFAGFAGHHWGFS